jgi:carboxymethylenebutenolidase
MLTENAVEIRTADGTSDAVIIRPSGDGAWPGVLHLSDIRGLREAHLQLSRRIAALGYVVLTPNVFYRTARPPVFDFPFKPGDERTMKRFAELSGPLTPESQDRDAASYVDSLRAQSSVGTGTLAVVGHCFTGGMALRAAASRPDRVALAVSLHGSRLATDAEGSPHRLLPRISSKARLYFAHATNDGSMPAPAIETLTRALADWGGPYESEVYPAAHGWTMPDAAAYDAAQADRAFEKVKSLLSTTLIHS